VHEELRAQFWLRIVSFTHCPAKLTSFTVVR